MSHYHKYLNDIQGSLTAHGSGTKFVFRNNEQLDSSLTQIAFGKFQPGEICERHMHPTMDECFYFIKGHGEYLIGEELVVLIPGTFLLIPAGREHELRALGDEPLEFVYWGVALAPC